VSEPVRDAVILAAPEDASTRVAGVPLLVRTILILQKAGIERVHVAGPVSAPADARIRVPVGGAPPPDAAHLVIGAGTVVDQTVVRAATAAHDPVCWECEGARIERRPTAQPCHATSPPVGTLLPVSASRSTVEQALLRGLENPHDGYLDRLIHRRLSRAVTPFLLRTRLTPNHVTVIGVLVGIVGGVLLGAPSTMGVAAGVMALVLSGVLDCSDGEIARITFAESRLGHLLDITGDTLVHAALLAGIAMQLGRSAAWPGTTTLVLLGIGMLGSFAAITWSEHTEARRRRVADAWENRVLDGVLSPLTTRDWYVFPIAFALAGRLDVLVPAAAWGAQVFWVAVAVLVWRVLGRAPG
jgi:phosphatidylglycerophosphate synthase